MNIAALLKKLLIFLLSSVCVTFARPSNFARNQEMANDFESKLTELQNDYAYQSPFMQDNQLIEKLLLLYMYPDSSSLDKNNDYRVPESKRQVRYRQCYFNPISCFKK